MALIGRRRARPPRGGGSTVPVHRPVLQAHRPVRPGQTGKARAATWPRRVPSHRRRAAADSRRWPRGVRSYRAESPLAEAFESLIDPSGKPGLAALEQRQAGPRRDRLPRERPDGLANQLSLAAAAARGDPLEVSLEIIRKVDGRLLHAIQPTIHPTGPPRGRGPCAPIRLTRRVLRVQLLNIPWNGRVSATWRS